MGKYLVLWYLNTVYSKQKFVLRPNQQTADSLWRVQLKLLHSLHLSLPAGTMPYQVTFEAYNSKLCHCKNRTYSVSSVCEASQEIYPRSQHLQPVSQSRINEVGWVTVLRTKHKIQPGLELKKKQPHHELEKPQTCSVQYIPATPQEMWPAVKQRCHQTKIQRKCQKISSPWEVKPLGELHYVRLHTVRNSYCHSWSYSCLLNIKHTLGWLRQLTSPS